MKTQVILMSIVLLTGFASALNTKKVPPQAIQEPLPLISQALIDETGLTYNWQMNIPTKQGESIASLRVLGPYLYVQTDMNAIFCVNRQKGNLLFTEQLASPNIPVYPPLYYAEKFWFVIGSEMVVLDPSVGYITEKSSLSQIGNISPFGFSRNADHLFLAGSDRRIHAINTDGYWQQFTASADNDSEIVTVVATDEIVIFATRAGNVVGMNPAKAQKYWQFDVTGEIQTPLILDGEAVYIGSMDSKLYKLNIKSGVLMWDSPFHSGSPINGTFTVGKDLIFMANALNGLYGVDKQTGKAAWRVTGGQGMICEAGGKSFVFAAPGILKCMDNKTGKELYSLNVVNVQKYADNTTDAEMYLAGNTGRLMCLTAR